MEFNNRKSYVNRDIVQIRKDLISGVKELTDKWTDFSESDVGVVLLEAVAGVADMLNYYLDEQALETFLPTAKEEKNIRAILSTMNYELPMWSSARCNQVFRLTEPWDTKVTIPAYTIINSTQRGIPNYSILSDVVIDPGQMMVSTIAYQGTPHKLELSVGEVKKSYKQLLPNLNIFRESIRVTVGDDIWNLVPDAFLEYKGGKLFSVHRDRYNRPYLMFSWNWKAMLPTDDNAKMTIMFLETDGEEGTVTQSVLDRIATEVYDEEGNKLGSNKISTFNTERSIGGSGDIDINLAKANAKNYIKTMDKLVTLNDYKWFIERYPGVSKVQCLDWSVPGNYVEKPYVVDAYIVPNEGGNLNEAFTKELLEDIRKKNVVSTKVRIKNPDYVELNIDVELTIRGNQLQAESIRKIIESVLRVEFCQRNMSFDQPIWVDRIRSLIMRESNLIFSVNIKSPTKDFRPNKVQFPVVKSIKVTTVLDGGVYE